MYLNTYLPIALLEHIDRDKFSESIEFIDDLIRCYIPNEYTQSLNHLDPYFDYLRNSDEALEEEKLDVKKKYNIIDDHYFEMDSAEKVTPQIKTTFTK